MVADHQKAVAGFIAEANTGTNSAVTPWAAKTLPALPGHLKLAHDLQRNSEVRPHPGRDRVGGSLTVRWIASATMRRIERARRDAPATDRPTMAHR